MKNRIYIAGHLGMVGSSIVKKIKDFNSDELIFRTRNELDLTNQHSVKIFFKEERPTHVYLAAAKVGGIVANDKFSGDFLYENLMIQSNIIHQAFRQGVKKILFLGSSCIYPKFATQPISEDELLAGYLEPTNDAYAIAKIAGIKLCESYNKQYKNSHGIDYRSVMPSNLYGIGDTYNLQNSHVIPALIMKFHKAQKTKTKTVDIWGTGSPMREFLFVEDLAEACIFIMNLSESSFYKQLTPGTSHINVGSNKDISIKELAELIKEVSGFKGNLNYDKSKPDGTPRKLMDSSKIMKLGWKPKTSILEGLKIVYENYIQNNQ
jgi:GDP-L-fucose synthase